MNPICYNSVTNHVYTQIKVSNAKPHTVQPKKENLIELFSVNQGRLSSRIRDFRLLHIALFTIIHTYTDSPGR
jgi:hypothetical protein